ncbi:hypothetical protein SDC9_156384 [bioreactor metagenome]|uniref:Uncharacterized protein n=1 Tax=bioreactor metagenome TaxID=1076179 RepID=A0A645F639_9ZZZZ
MFVKERTFSVPLADMVPPIIPMASYALSENESTLLLITGSASNDMAKGVMLLEPIVVLEIAGFDVPSR